MGGLGWRARLGRRREHVRREGSGDPSSGHCRDGEWRIARLDGRPEQFDDLLDGKFEPFSEFGQAD